MDYLEAAREAYECAELAESGYLTEEYCRYAEICARIAIAEQLCKLNENLGNLRFTAEASSVEMGYVPQV